MTVSIAKRSGDGIDPAPMPLVLMYHSVSPYDEDPYEVTVSPERFECQMRWLRARGLRGVSMRELLDAAAEGRSGGLVGLTFDDGYQDFAMYARPTLQQYGFTATAFVLAGWLGGHNEWDRPGPRKALLTARQVCEIDDAGIEIGSHGVRHLSLTKVDPVRRRDEIVRSRAILQEMLGREVLGFCYPYGHVDEHVRESVRVAGYDYACAIWASRGIGRHAIPRTYVHDHDSAWRLDAKRLVSRLTVGNRFAVRRHRSGA
jgi:peptidoglycan/xylan/chitin deacetylase (PgdA/CDA1 family)